MFGLGTPELIVILIIAFLVFGGKKLPELGRDLGKGIRAFKKSLSDVQEDEKELLPENTELHAAHKPAPAANASTSKKTLDGVPAERNSEEDQTP